MPNVRSIIGIIFLLGITTQQIYGSEAMLKVGDRPPALDFTVYKSEKHIDWQSLKDRVAVLEFWATWCPPCIENIPHMNELVQKFSDKPVTFISVTYETEAMVQPFLQKHPINSIVGLDNDFAMFRNFKAWGIPMAVIVNKKGRIVSVLHPSNLNATVLDEALAGKIPHVEPATPWPDPKGAEQYFRSLVKKTNSNK